jgi:hypothetical protein
MVREVECYILLNEYGVQIPYTSRVKGFRVLLCKVSKACNGNKMKRV